jgi:hypothetical protein
MSRTLASVEAADRAIARLLIVLNVLDDEAGIDEHLAGLRVCLVDTINELKTLRAPLTARGGAR